MLPSTIAYAGTWAICINLDLFAIMQTVEWLVLGMLCKAIHSGMFSIKCFCTPTPMNVNCEKLVLCFANEALLRVNSCRFPLSSEVMEQIGGT